MKTLRASVPWALAAGACFLLVGPLQAQPKKGGEATGTVSEYVKTTSADGSTVTYSNLGVGGSERITLKDSGLAKCFDAKFDDCRADRSAVGRAFPDPETRKGKSQDRLCGEIACKACKGAFAEEPYKPWNYACNPAPPEEKSPEKKKKK